MSRGDSGAACRGATHTADAWLGRFVRLRGLRAGARFERHVVRDVHSGERRVVITGKPGVAGTGERLAAAGRALALLHHPHVPRVDAWDDSGEAPWLALCCDAEDDLENVWAKLASTDQKLSVAASWGLADCLLDVIAHAHQHRDPHDGGPLCMGSMAWSNVLVSACGKPWLLGFGDDLSLDELATSAVRAPEVAVGARPWPGSDLWAVLTLFRTLLPLRELPPPVARVMRGQARVEDAAVHARLSALHATLLSEPAERTRDVRWVRETYRALWAELGVSADLAAFQAVAARAVRERSAPRRSVLRVASDGSAFSVDEGPRVDLIQRHVARRLLLALVEHARDPDAAPLSTFALREAGWPGERMQPEAGAHRVHVALHSLRKLGLAQHLVRGEHGYQLIGPLERGGV